MGGTDYDYYALLGVAETASNAEITTAYRRLAKTLHPDAGGGTAGLFGVITEARDVLSDPQRRAAYDRARTGLPQADEPKPPPPPAPPQDYVEEDWSPDPPGFGVPPPGWAAPPPYAAPQSGGRWAGDLRFAEYRPDPGDTVWGRAWKALCRTALRLPLPRTIWGWPFAFVVWLFCLGFVGYVVQRLPPEVRPWGAVATNLLLAYIPMLLLIVRLWLSCRLRYARWRARREARWMH